jgi:predicted nucleotide-binding protein (sugar kinase/HSP70/actin superfamily)
VAHGHIRWLIEKKTDYILIPNYISSPGPKADKPAFFCPWNQTLPFITRVAPFISEYRQRIISPTLWFNHGTRAVAQAIRNSLKDAGIRCSSHRVELAVERGLAAMASFHTNLLSAGAKALASISENNEYGIVLLGRPYNMYDKGINLDIATKMRKYYGANVLGLDFLDADGGEVAQYNDNMYWSYGTRILEAAAFVKNRPNLHIVYITNFMCGPDSYIKHFITEVSGRPFLTLQFDGHNNDAGMLTRCEAYLDSKGVLRRWGSTEQEMPASAGNP